MDRLKKSIIKLLLTLAFMFTFTAIDVLFINDTNISDKLFILVIVVFVPIVFWKELVRLELKIIYPLVFWIIFNLIAMYVYGISLGAIFFLVNYIVQVLLLVCFVIVFYKYGSIRDKMLKIMYNIAVVIALIGIIEKHFYEYVIGFLSVFRQKIYIYGRVSSMFDNPNHFAVFSVIFLLIGLYMLHFKKKKSAIIFNGIILLGLLYSGGRTALLSLGVGIIVFYFQYFKRYKIRNKSIKILVISLLTVIIIGTFAFLGYLDRFTLIFTSIRNGNFEVATGYRLEIWRKAIYIFKSSPLIGIGSGNFSRQVFVMTGQYEGVHSLYFSLLSENGLIGTVLFMAFILKVYSYRKYIKLNDEYVLFITLFITMMVSQITEMQFYNVFQFIFVFWFICAIPIAEKIKVKEKNNENSSSNTSSISVE